MIILFLQGATLALSATVMPGPFQTFLLSRALSSGWRSTLPAALVPVFSDGPIIVVFLLLLTKVPHWFLDILRVAGGSFILYLARGAFLSLKAPDLNPEAARKEGRQSFKQALAINLLNPNPYIFWGVLGVPIILSGWRQSPTLGLAFVVGFFGTFIFSLGVLIVVFATAGRLNPKVVFSLRIIAAFALLAFGFYQMITGIHALIR